MNEHEYKFGANILENLTTGMYQDSRTIYREYIQNACDSIDEAIRSEILTEVDAEIKITIDRQNRKIVIEDNAMGIPDEKFESILGNIADSEKRIGVNRGFRGIGRLCGLAYCKTLRFVSKFKGESRERSMTCDAKKMRDLIYENNLNGKQYSAQQVLDWINEFGHRRAENPDAHFFRVELEQINPENMDLLDIDKVREYLSFVAPVDYQPNFQFQDEIKNHASELGFKIETYQITINGEPIFKNYQTRFKTKLSTDEVFGVEFENFIDAQGEFLAWMWWGKSNLKGVISAKDNPPMRGLRLRAGNIQIGDEGTLKKFFTEDRGTTYFIGEVFIVSKDLIPNSQRDYLNENPTRINFERLMTLTFHNRLTKIYRAASVIRSNQKKIEKSKRARREFDEMKAQGKFISEDHLREEEEKLEQKQIDAEKAAESLEKFQRSLDEQPSIIEEIFQNAEEEIIESEQPAIEIPAEEKKFFREEKLQHLPEHDREMLKKIFEIIRNSTPEETSTMLIDKIEDEFK